MSHGGSYDFAIHESFQDFGMQKNMIRDQKADSNHKRKMKISLRKISYQKYDEKSKPIRCQDRPELCAGSRCCQSAIGRGDQCQKYDNI